MSKFFLRSLVSTDIAASLDLWSETPGIGWGLSDRAEDLIKFLQQNPGLSRVACVGNQIVGTAMCGHDGRRGFLYHVAVAATHEKQGVGRALVEACVGQLGRCDIPRATIHIFSENPSGIQFWQSVRWRLREDLAVMQFQS